MTSNHIESTDYLETDQLGKETLRLQATERLLQAQDFIVLTIKDGAIHIVKPGFHKTSMVLAEAMFLSEQIREMIGDSFAELSAIRIDRSKQAKTSR